MLDNTNLNDYECWAFDNDGELWQMFIKDPIVQLYDDFCEEQYENESERV